jgi:hypothetical protein
VILRDGKHAGNRGPSNTELAAKANWTRVYEPKNIRIVRLVHKIA